MAGWHFRQDDLDSLQRKMTCPTERKPIKIEYAMSLKEISEEIGVSKERTRQIINSALKKLRKRYVDY